MCMRHVMCTSLYLYIIIFIIAKVPRLLHVITIVHCQLLSLLFGLFFPCIHKCVWILLLQCLRDTGSVKARIFTIMRTFLLDFLCCYIKCSKRYRTTLIEWKTIGEKWIITIVTLNHK